MLAEKMANLTVRATSPDGGLEAVLTHPVRLDLIFAPATYRRYREERLGRQLAAVATNLWTGHRRAFLAALGAALGEQADGLAESDSDPVARRYREAIASIVVDHRSPGGRVRVKTRALVRWDVEIRPGTVAALSEPEFRQEALAAGQAVVDEYLGQVRELRDEHYGKPGARMFDPWREGRIPT